MKQRKTRISPAQRDILLILEDAGEEQLDHLMTEMMFGGAVTAGGHKLDKVDAAIRGLHMLGLVNFATEVSSHDSKKHVIDDIAVDTFRMEEYIELEELENRWKWKIDVNRPIFLILTRDGEEFSAL